MSDTSTMTISMDHYYARRCTNCDKMILPNTLHICGGDLMQLNVESGLLVFETGGNVGLSDGIPGPGGELDICDHSPVSGDDLPNSWTACPDCNETIAPGTIHACDTLLTTDNYGGGETEQTESILWTYDDSGNVYIRNTFDLPQSVGYYDLDGFQIWLDKKPRWLHRLMVRMQLGWKWVDG